MSFQNKLSRENLLKYGFTPERRNFILRMRDLKLRVGLSQSQIYAMVADGTFPQPFPLTPGGSAMGWFEGQIEDYLAARLMDLPPPIIPKLTTPVVRANR